ncbi:MAG: MBL fold metallo-hydrolase [Deltaproteobacteria bacterium]|nr:MBL fold metallo-hydrolase [Deltaproteobacteria bacterium]
MKRSHHLPWALLLLPVLGCPSADEPVPEPDPTPAPLTAFEQAVDALGGADALSSLAHLRIEASGDRWIDYEGLVPSELHDACTYATTSLFDLSTGDARVDVTRTGLFEAFQFFPEETYSVVLNGDVGGLTAQAGFYPVGAMPSQHVGALRRQHRLFNPHLVLRDALANASSVTDGGEQDLDGRAHRLFTLTDEGSDLRMFVDSETGLISKLETMENSPLLRDVPVEVRFGDWQASGELTFPRTVELWAVEGLVQGEARSAIEVDPTDVAADAFALPPEAGAPVVDADAFAFGHESHQVVEAFFQIFFGYDPGGSSQASELAPGVVLFAAGANSLGIEVDGGVVLLEGPNSPAHGSHIVEMVASEFPGLPITHLIQSHHHQDHSAGVRSIAAAGAKVVVGPGVGSFFEDVLAAPSTIRPDALSMSDATTEVEEVPANGTTVIADADVTVTAYHFAANPHADDMVVTLVDLGTSRFLYQADLYNGGFGFTAVVGGQAALFAGLRDLGILDADCNSPVPLSIVSAHGLVQTVDESLTELSGLGVDVGCP